MRCALCGEETSHTVNLIPQFRLSEDEKESSVSFPLCVEDGDRFNDGLIGICFNKEQFIVKSGSSYFTADTKVDIGDLKEEYISQSNEKCHKNIQLKLGKLEIPGSEHWCDG